MNNTALAYGLPTAPLLTLLEEARRRATGPEPSATAPAACWNEALFAPLAEYLARPGKEFRAELVLAAYRLGGQSQPPPPELPWFVEALHAGSLVIDDIEDGSARRRGGPALHVVMGLSRALNAGNWLYFWALDLIHRLGLPPATELALHRAATTALREGHEGQALDLSVRVTDLAQDEVARTVATVTRLKTGSLMALAATTGALAGGANQERVRAVAGFGRELGAALQMLDDLGGLTREDRAHKGHEDLLLGRPTWPWAWAAEGDSRDFAGLLELSREVQARSTHPEHLARALRQRVAERGREEARERVRGALSTLAAHPWASSSVVSALRSEIERLERSHG